MKDSDTVRNAITTLERWIDNLTRNAERYARLAETAPSYEGNGSSADYWRKQEEDTRRAASCYADARNLLTGDETS